MNSDYRNPKSEDHTQHPNRSKFPIKKIGWNTFEYIQNERDAQPTNIFLEAFTPIYFIYYGMRLIMIKSVQ